MKEEKIEDVELFMPSQDICSGCGTCAAFCDICPIVSFSKPELEKAVFGTVREDEDLGYYKKILAVRSKKKEILERAQDGGAVTSFLLCALENGLIDGAVVANREEDWNPSSGVAKSAKDVIKGAGTKYSRVTAPMKFGETMREIRKLAMVGTGCQTTGARRAQNVFLKDLLEITAESENPLNFLLIGLFCFENFPYECLKKVIETEYGLKMEDIAKTDITKGKFIVTKKDGETIQKPVKIFNECISECCHLCINFTSNFADISCGSVGTDPGWSTVIVRTDKGLELFEKAKELGYIEVQDKVSLDAIRFTFGLKDKSRKHTTEEREKEGLYVPDYSMRD
jgi:coenzyme F420 hydrogenase subunit beta